MTELNNSMLPGELIITDNDQLYDCFDPGEYDKVFLLVDEHTEELCLPALNSVGALPESRVEIRIPSGEANKTLENCRVIWDVMLENNASRHSCLVVLGGGLLCDMGALSASLFKRGMHLILIPTTLLAQIDASIGGKTAVNYKNIKNIIGCFNAADKVVINPDFLQTLPEREFVAGFGEILKHSLITDVSLFFELIKTEPLTAKAISPYLLESISIKSEIVQKDPREVKLRKILNFGHTLGHGFESFSFRNEQGEPLLHGEAVILGMIGELYLSEKLYNYNSAPRIALESFFKKRLIPFCCHDNDAEQIIDYIYQDKKNRGDRMIFALPDSNTSMNPEAEVVFSDVRESIIHVIEFINKKDH